jgi:hypothetical protein
MIIRGIGSAARNANADSTGCANRPDPESRNPVTVSMSLPRLKRHFFSPLEMSRCASRSELCPPSGQLSSSAEAPAFPSRPDNGSDAGRSGGDGRSGAARSHAQRPLRCEHGEDGEHQTFRGASTVARSAQAGGTGGECGLSGFSPAATRSAATAAAIWRDGRPFVGWPGASRLFGGRCRAG